MFWWFWLDLPSLPFRALLGCQARLLPGKIMTLVTFMMMTMYTWRWSRKFSPSRPSFAPRSPSLQSYRPPTYLMTMTMTIETSPMVKTDCCRSTLSASIKASSRSPQPGGGAAPNRTWKEKTCLRWRSCNIKDAFDWKSQATAHFIQGIFCSSVFVQQLIIAWL